MIKTLKNEQWKEIKFKKGALRLRYAVSNHGRISSFRTHVQKDGSLLKGSAIDGYSILNVRPEGKSQTLFIHRLVADNFCKKIGGKQLFAIHLDFDKSNNAAKNLKWVSKVDMEKHQQKNPNVLKARKERKKIKPTEGLKLTTLKVKQIKKIIFSKKRSLKMSEIASKFNISEM
ncbi:MAG: NUMOD4 domain-containing protein, partial [Flavobacteriales bacterium]